MKGSREFGMQVNVTMDGRGKPLPYPLDDPSPARHTPERVFQRHVVKLAKLRGWWVYHTFDSRRSEPGFPDLVLVRPPRCLFRELKTDKGRLTSAQEATLLALEACGCDAKVWRPALWDLIEQELA